MKVSKEPIISDTRPKAEPAPDAASGPSKLNPSASASSQDTAYNHSMEFETLTGVTRNPEKLRYVLTFVDQVSKVAPGSAMAFKKALRKAAGWANQPIRAVALVLAWLCKHDFVMKIRDDQDLVINYRLTPRGASLALSGMGAASGPATEEQTTTDEQGTPRRAILPDLDPGSLLIRFRDKAQELANAGQRLEANRERYRELQIELKRLDEEYNDIARILVANREASALLCRLLEMQAPMPTKS